MPHRLLRSALLTAVAAALLCAPAAADAAITGEVHVTFPAASGTGAVTATAAAVGDVDGDGRADTAVSVPAGTGGAIDYTLWVTFAPATAPSSVTAGQAGWHGFSIAGLPRVQSIVGVNDLDGDGRREVALALGDGRTVVVYGQADGTALDLASLGTNGFTIQNTSLGAVLETGSAQGDFLDGHTVASLGDQDGDGRADLAVVAAGGISVVRSPAPGGTVDAAAVGPDRLLHASAAGVVVAVGSLGDLDGDGRNDLAVAWQGGDSAPHVAGLAGEPLGADVDLAHAAGGGRGFLLDGAAGAALRSGTTVGDQNGDGRRDLALSISRGLWRVTTPALGTHGALDTGGRGIGDVFSDELVAVGDVDGDGLEDTASSVGLQLTKLLGWTPAGQPYPMPSKIIGSVPDRNGDGQAEPVGLHADPFDGFGGSTHEAAYQLETYLTQPVIPTGPPQGGGLQPGISDPCRVVPTACGPGPATSKTAAPVRPVAVAPVKHVGKRLTGTKRGDRLTGTAYADVIKGLGGNDTIKALGGNDAIDGGVGRDRIDAGAGNDAIRARDGQADTIECGAGKDSVVADRNDRVKHCEKVSRPKARAKKKR